MPSTDVTYVALSDSNSNLWWGAVIGGFVVVLAVAALLTILVIEVRTIDRRVVKVRDTLQAAVDNTADTALIAEGLQHHLVLGRVLDKVRT